MKKLLIVPVLLMASMSASATSLIVGGLSYHFDRDSEMNEVNPAIGIEHKGFSAIYVDKNSVEQKSVQITYGDDFYHESWWTVGYRIGVASGYKRGQVYADGKKCLDSLDMGGGIIPLAALELTIDTPIPNLSLVSDVNPFVVMMGFKYTL